MGASERERGGGLAWWVVVVRGIYHIAIGGHKK